MVLCTICQAVIILTDSVIQLWCLGREERTQRLCSSLLTLQLAGGALLLLLLREGLLQPADLLLVLGCRAPPVVQLGAHAAEVGLQGGDLALPLQRGSLHGVPQDKDLKAEAQCQ